jgi:hypothetical protein
MVCFCGVSIERPLCERLRAPRAPSSALGVPLGLLFVLSETLVFPISWREGKIQILVSAGPDPNSLLEAVLKG